MATSPKKPNKQLDDLLVRLRESGTVVELMELYYQGDEKLQSNPRVIAVVQKRRAELRSLPVPRVLRNV